MSTQIMQTPFPRADLRVHETRVFERRLVETLDSFFVHQECGSGSLYSVSRYHSNSNHVCKLGCPGFLYTWGIPFEGPALQCNDVESKVYSTYKVKRKSKRRLANPWAEENVLKWNRNMNNTSLSVMFVGDFDGPDHKGSDDVTDSQILALTQLILWVTDPIRPWSISRQAVMGHCHVRKPACPGFAVTDFIEKCVWNDKQWDEHLIRTGIRTEINVLGSPEPEVYSLSMRESLADPEEELKSLLKIAEETLARGDEKELILFIDLMRKAFFMLPKTKQPYWLKKTAAKLGTSIPETLGMLMGFNQS